MYIYYTVCKEVAIILRGSGGCFRYSATTSHWGSWHLEVSTINTALARKRECRISICNGTATIHCNFRSSWVSGRIDMLYAIGSYPIAGNTMQRFSYSGICVAMSLTSAVNGPWSSSGFKTPLYLSFICLDVLPGTNPSFSISPHFWP